jgi:hypothetical protein
MDARGNDPPLDDHLPGYNRQSVPAETALDRRTRWNILAGFAAA